MIKTLALAVLFFSLFQLSAQTYRSAVVVNNNGDTLKGWIDYQNWNANPRKIRFKTDSAATTSLKYGVGDISYFEIRGLDAYKRAFVTKDMRPVTIAGVNEYTADTVAADTVFLQTLVGGTKYVLYRLLDEKEHFYLQVPGGIPVELSYKFYFDKNTNQSQEIFAFRDELKRIAAMDNRPDLYAEIDQTRYTIRSLSRAILDLNGEAASTVYSIADKKSRNLPQFFVSAGVSDSRFSASGQYTVVGMDYKATLSPSFAIGLDFLSPRNFNDFTFRVELTYFQNTYKGDMTGPSQNTGEPIYSTYTLEQRNISPSLSALYNFRRRKKVRFYVGGGVAYTISSYGTNRYTSKDLTGRFSYENTTTDNYLDAKKWWLSVQFKIGARLNDHCDIGATIAPIGTSVVDYRVFSAQVRTYSLRVSWFISNHHKRD